MSELALQVHSLRKSYGAFEAVKSISFEVAKGEIFALIGPNGAGKSTTLRTVATLLTPSSGEVTVGGHDTQKEADRVRSLISYLPEEAGAYKNLSGEAYLRFMAGLYCNSRDEIDQAVARANEICALGSRLKDEVRTYSKGMSRKLLLARSVMTKPVLAILDEPTGGLDILNAREIRQTIRDLTSSGTAVLLSSHNMLEVEFLSDRVGIIHQGVLHETGTAASLKRKYQAANLEEVFVKAIQS